MNMPYTNPGRLTVFLVASCHPTPDIHSRAVPAVTGLYHACFTDCQQLLYSKNLRNSLDSAIFVST
ncbi:MAG TPA: hypothetical protein VIM06_10335, partial [Rhodanobacter sp.]